MRCDVCGSRLRVRQTQDAVGTGLSGAAGRAVEAYLADRGLAEATVTVRDRVCDGCGRVVGTAELSIEAMSKIA
jgi:hypothetical protein